MTRLGPVPARKLLRFLLRRGYSVEGQRGSHVKLRRVDGKIVVLPNHPGRDLKVGLLRAILKEAGIPVDEFLRER